MDKGKLDIHYKKWSKLYTNLKISQQEEQAQTAYINNYLNLL